MTPGQFYFSLLNPAIAVVFTLVFFLLWLRWPARHYLLLLATGVFLSGCGFVLLDFDLPMNLQAKRFISNASFTLCIFLCCCAAFTRVGLKVPVMTFTVITALGFTAFTWYLLVDPWIEARIAILGAIYAGLTLTCIWQLTRHKPLQLADKLIVGAALFGFLLSVGRPALTFVGIFDTGSEASFLQSSYWLAVQAFSPVLTGIISMLFLAAMAMDIFAQLRSEADNDYLTGLLNRRGFSAAVERAMNGAHGHPALLMADIDNFKAVNDSFGHEVGDRVIIAVAQVLAVHGRAAAVGRIGGEEYALFYPDAAETNLNLSIMQIQASLAACRIEGLPRDYRLTVSMGLHSATNGENLSDMLTKADRALYRAKAQGKDQAVQTSAQLRIA